VAPALAVDVTTSILRTDPAIQLTARLIAAEQGYSDSACDAGAMPMECGAQAHSRF
jgi:hypothetical protein